MSTCRDKATEKANKLLLKFGIHGFRVENNNIIFYVSKANEKLFEDNKKYIEDTVKPFTVSVSWREMGKAL